MDEQKKKKIQFTTRDLTMTSIFTVLIIIGAFIKIPIPVVPFTLQVFFTTLAGLVLGAKRGCIAVCAYIFLGLVGVPVFAEGGSIAYVIKPSFGYIIGFAVGAFVAGKIANVSNKPSLKRLFVASGASLAIVYLVGISYFALISNVFGELLGVGSIGFVSLMLYCFVLVVPGDIVLCILGAIVAKRLIPIVANMDSEKRIKDMQIKTLKEYKEKIFDGQQLDKEELISLFSMPLNEVCSVANSIREHFCKDSFDMCTIINAKSGKCSEDCKYCSQSSHYKTTCDVYDLLDTDTIVTASKKSEDCGIKRFSLVTSGKRVSDKEVDQICNSVKAIKESCDIKVCGSLGLLGESQFKKLYDAGLKRVHNNLETSESYFPSMCSTHTFADKLKAINDAKKAGMSICSGGIFGIGETNSDRVDLAISLRENDIKSVPINFLIAVDGTPYQDMPSVCEDEARAIVAVFRFALPDAYIRLAGGRILLSDNGKKCFLGGANACISGDLLTTTGLSVKKDIDMLRYIGYNI